MERQIFDDTGIKDFFKNLALRMTKENDVSDCVWALCESNLGFRQFFLDFFFPGKLKSRDVSIKREVVLEGGRPDFVITRVDDESDCYFVEVKLWDVNHHFEQYAEELKKRGLGIERLGYITQYKLAPTSLSDNDRQVAWADGHWTCQVKTWELFLQTLKDHMDRDDPANQWAKSYDALGLYSFVSTVCPNFEAVNSFYLDKNRMKQIKTFSKSVDSVVNGEIEIGNRKLQLKGYYSKRDYEFSLGYIGRYFCISGLLDEPIWGWLGAYFPQENRTPGLTLEFDNNIGWGAPVFKNLKSKASRLDYCAPLTLSANGNEMVNNIRAALAKMLEECTEKEPQKTFNDTCQDKSDELSDARRLTLFLDQNVFVNKDGDDRLEFCFEQLPADDFSATRWIGRYGQVVCAGERTLVWVGIRYDDDRVMLKSFDGHRELIADGGELVLEIGTERYEIGGEGTLDADDIRRKILDAVKRYVKH